MPLDVRGWPKQDREGGCYRLGRGLACLGQCLFLATGLSEFCRLILGRLAGDTRELIRMTLVQWERPVRRGSALGAPPGLHDEPECRGGRIACHGKWQSGLASFRRCRRASVSARTPATRVHVAHAFGCSEAAPGYRRDPVARLVLGRGAGRGGRARDRSDHQGQSSPSHRVGGGFAWLRRGTRTSHRHGVRRRPRLASFWRRRVALCGLDKSV